MHFPANSGTWYTKFCKYRNTVIRYSFILTMFVWLHQFPLLLYFFLSHLSYSYPPHFLSSLVCRLWFSVFLSFYPVRNWGLWTCCLPFWNLCNSLVFHSLFFSYANNHLSFPTCICSFHYNVAILFLFSLWSYFTKPPQFINQEYTHCCRKWYIQS